MNVYFVLLAYNRFSEKNEILGTFENFKVAEEMYDKKILMMLMVDIQH